MRRPSLGQTEDDLSRLTSVVVSPSTESTPSTQTNENGSLKINCNNNIVDGQSLYLPNIINSSEWQNCRKRKERQDSTSSTNQDRKLVRSNSEEHLPNCQEVIRRVASHEDFKTPSAGYEFKVADENTIPEIEEKSNNQTEEDSSDSLSKFFIGTDSVVFNSVEITIRKADRHSPSRKDCGEDSDCENERRRSSERFSKTRIPSGRKSVSPRSRSKNSVKGNIEGKDFILKYDVCTLTEEQRKFGGNKGETTVVRDEVDCGIVADYNDNSLMDVTKSPREKLPWNRSFNDEIPIVSQRFSDQGFEEVTYMEKFGKLPSIPSGSDLKAAYGNHLRTENVKVRDSMMTKMIPPTNNVFQTPDERLKQISKKLNTLKKKVNRYEESFERDNGYRPSHADKSNDKQIKNAIVEIHKLRKEKSQLKADPIAAMGYKTIATTMSEDKRLAKMKDTIADIEKRLVEKRQEDSRIENVDNLSADQLIEEKTAVQKGLLYLESLYGRPNTREERDVARPLYDRYRQLKRMVNRHNSFSGPIELPTILEHEALAITEITLPLSTDISPPSAILSDTSGHSDDSETISNTVLENIHAMSMDELWDHYDVTREEKKELRRSIKIFELEFEQTTGRKMLKADRKHIDETYAMYKQKKATLRLLDALVKKQLAA